jgi:hypothetical protein
VAQVCLAIESRGRDVGAVECGKKRLASDDECRLFQDDAFLLDVNDGQNDTQTLNTACETTSWHAWFGEGSELFWSWFMRRRH